MTATTLTCIEIRCTVCDYRLDEDYEGIEHFDSIEEAIKNHSGGESDDWIIRPDGYAICPADFDEDHDRARAALAGDGRPLEHVPGQTEIALAEVSA